MTDRAVYAGRHIILECYEVDTSWLTDSAKIEQDLKQSAVMAGATVLHSHFHHFGDGYGVTGVVILAESHISIHTWPEANYAALDIFMCGTCDPQTAVDALFKLHNFPKFEITTHIRGYGIESVHAMCTESS